MRVFVHWMASIKCDSSVLGATLRSLGTGRPFLSIRVADLQEQASANSP